MNLDRGIVYATMSPRPPLAILLAAIPALAGLSGCHSEPQVIACPADDAVKPASRGLTIDWDKETLRIHGAGIPGGVLEVWYLEAVCRSGSTDREWAQTVIQQTTEKVELSADSKHLKLVTHVAGGVELSHDIRAGEDDVSFEITATSHGAAYVDAVWAQPCLRVASFTGREQSDYFEKCFIFLDEILTPLDTTRREEEALYRGGQVYIPHEIDRADVNPRPLSPDEPSNGLIGCLSADGTKLLAMAWEPYQELFQGVRVCVHSDFRIGGLEPGESRKIRGKIYLLDNDPETLLRRYQKDFGEE